MQETFRNHIESEFPEMLKEPFLLACSGGLDSMVLLDLCVGTGLRFEVAHCNFQLRGSESNEDAEFVRKHTKKNDLLIHVKNFETEEYSSINKVSIQESARVLRYDWFDSLLEEQKLHYILTAHHLDDQLETFLINLTRGTGLEGLGGIPARTPKILRPLLIFTRKQIRAYAQARGLVWRDDSSNLEDKYLRNRLRQEVIPALKKTDPRFEANFLKTLGYLRGSQVLIQNHLADVKSNLFTTEDTHWRIPVDGLRKLEPLAAYLHALFREYGFTDWDAMENLLNSSSGKVLYSPTHRLLRDRESLLLKQREKPDSGIYEIDLAASGTVAPVWLVVTEVLELGECLPHVLYIDKETLKKGLQVRRWRKGDYFYPLGMKGKQKVSKYFKDHKFSQFEKESQWLLCSGEEIVWIVGHRADDRFKVRNGTKHILRIEWKESGAA